MTNNWKDSLTEQLCEAFLSAKNKEEMYDFLEDVATISEIKAFSQRLEVAKLLNHGMSYPQISQKTGASTTTISRVKKCLEYGAGGYVAVLERLPG